MAEGMLWGESLGFDAAGAIVQYTAVKLIDADTVGPVTAESDVIVGISMYNVSAGEITKGKGVSVCLDGAPLVKVGSGGVTAGAIVVSDASGQAVASNSGARPLGIALASGNAGDLVPVLFENALPLVP